MVSNMSRFQYISAIFFLGFEVFDTMSILPHADITDIDVDINYVDTKNHSDQKTC